MNWTIPALVKSRVGSFPGTSEALGRTLCPFRSKYARKAERSSAPVLDIYSSPSGCSVLRRPMACRQTSAGSRARRGTGTPSPRLPCPGGSPPGTSSATPARPLPRRLPARTPPASPLRRGDAGNRARPASRRFSRDRRSALPGRNGRAAGTGPGRRAAGARAAARGPAGCRTRQALSASAGPSLPPRSGGGGRACRGRAPGGSPGRAPRSLYWSFFWPPSLSKSSQVRSEVEDTPRTRSEKSSGLLACRSASSRVMRSSLSSDISDWSNVCIP